MESRQTLAKIQGLPQQCMGLSLRGGYSHPCLFLTKPKHYKRGTSILAQLPLPVTETIAYFSTLQ